MSQPDSRNRLCQEILGGRLFPDQRGSALIILPFCHDEITEEILLSAQEAIFSFTPEHVRQTMPFVLDAMHFNRTKLFGSGFFDAFFLHVNYEFFLPIESGVESHEKYSQEYRQNWIAPRLSAMNRFELGWAHTWTTEILEDSANEVMMNFEQDLVMLSKLLGMALGKPENEC
ncbi:MAG: hypothetical protein ABJR46_16580 [Tateyamaria sp.]|uniref:hypothetical protein n=1 Tax=Tateyamaria sp. TaxID=1929288 RepID=UPI00329D0665